MAGHFTNLLYHITFSTKERVPNISSDIRSRLHGYMGGIINGSGGKPLIINGTADHVHLLAELEPDVAVADFVRIIKTNSSKWVHEGFEASRGFAWQAGYGAFTVSRSHVPAVWRYIERQEQHHKWFDFQEEFRKLLRAHNIEFDERYIWR